MATLITNTLTIADPYPPDAQAHVFHVESGAFTVVFFYSGGAAYVAIRDNTSGTWATPTTVLGLSAANFSATASAAQNGDSIYFTSVNGSTGDITVKVYRWNTSTNQFTAMGSFTALGIQYNYTVGGGAILAATGSATTYSVTDGALYVLVAIAVSGLSGYYPHVVSMDGGYQSSMLINTGSSSVVGTAATVAGSTPVFAVADAANVSLVTGYVATPVIPETAYSGSSIAGLSMAPAPGGLVDLFIQAGASLIARRRGGASSYSSVVVASSGVASVPSVTYDVATGNATIYWKSVSTQANGEIVRAIRGGGIWSSAAVVAGGDASGYQGHSAPPLTRSGTFDFTYSKGMSSPYSLYADTVLLGAAPNTPSVITPSGNVGTTSPAMHADYVNSAAPSDLLDAKEWMVTRASDAHVMWRSGVVASSSPDATYGATNNVADGNYHAAEALLVAVGYLAQTRQRDQVTQTFTPFSAAQSFQIVDPATVAINQIVNNSITYTSGPATIAAGLTTVRATPSQPGGHTFDQLQIDVTRTSDDLFAFTSGPIALSPAAASGAAIDQTVDLSSLTNGGDYSLRVTVRDSVTGLLATSSAFALHVAWVPPASATNVNAIPDHDEGWVTLSALDPGGQPYCRWEREIDGVRKVIYPEDGSARGPRELNITDYPIPGREIFYRIILINANLNESLPSEAAAILYGAHHGKLTIWLNDAQDPERRKVAFGFATDVGGVMGRQRVVTMQERMPLGGSKPKKTFSLRKHWYADGRQYIFPVSDGGVRFEGSYNTLVEMLDAGVPLRYRDLRGSDWIVTLDSLSDTIPFTQMGWPALAVTISFGEVLIAPSVVLPEITVP